MHKLMAFAIATLLPASAADAQMRSDQLLWNCTGSTANSEAEALSGKIMCVGYLSGFLDAYVTAASFHKIDPPFCLPASGISNDQILRLVVKYIENHPEDLHHSARGTVLLVLRGAFPCNPVRPYR